MRFNLRTYVQTTAFQMGGGLHTFVIASNKLFFLYLADERTI